MRADYVLAADGISSGPLQAIVILALAIASVLLFRSMAKHLRRVPRDFEPPPEDPIVPPEDRTP